MSLDQKWEKPTMELRLSALGWLASGFGYRKGSSKLNSYGLRGTQGVPAVVGDHWAGAPPAVKETEERCHSCLS